MKRIILFTVLCLAANLLLAQKKINVTNLLKELGSLKDQYNKSFEQSKFKDTLVLLYLPASGGHNFLDVYKNFKSKSFTVPTQIAGGFKNVMNVLPLMVKKSHLKDAMIGNFGKEFHSILLDWDNALMKTLSIKGFSIIKISIKNKKLIQLQDFGDKKEDFFKAVDPLFKD
ncbi:MAG: hypothetical protein SFU99_06610 [Saprospiraceae bacterium]|nr:hypothetical protein [Saprospiraceae bacterium]